MACSSIHDSRQPTSPIDFSYFETSSTALCGTTGNVVVNHFVTGMRVQEGLIFEPPKAFAGGVEEDRGTGLWLVYGKPVENVGLQFEEYKMQKR